MKVTLARSIGRDDLKALGTDREDLLEGATVDVPESLGTALVERKLAEVPTQRGVSRAPEIKGQKEQDAK